MGALRASPLQVIRGPEQAAAMLEPSRLRLLGELGQPASATELAKRLNLPRQRVNYHLRELERAGLVELQEERRKGNCVERVLRASARAYLVSPEVLGALGADPARIEDRLSSAFLVAVCGQAIRELAELRGRADRAEKKLATMTLQTEVRFAGPEAMNAFAEELGATLAHLAAKYHAEAAADGRLFKFFVGGYPSITKPEDPRPPLAQPEAPDDR